MRKLIISLIVIFSTNLFADEVKYETIEPQTVNNLSFRDSWDTTHKFCYVKEGGEASQPTCLGITGMGEVKLREKGAWVSDAESAPFIAHLSDALKADAVNFQRIYVRYLALGSSGEFAVHVFFVDKGGADRSAQTIFVFGQVLPNTSPVQTRLTTMSFSSPVEHLGAIMGVALTSPDFKNVDEINAKIVSEYLNLLRIGQDVVETYLNSTGQGAGAKLP